MEEDACRERTPRAAAIKVAAAMVIVVVAAADRAERKRERGFQSSVLLSSRAGEEKADSGGLFAIHLPHRSS